MGQEVMLVPDRKFASLLAKAGRHTSTVALSVLATVGTGFAEDVGADLHQRSQAAIQQADSAALEVTLLAVRNGVEDDASVASDASSDETTFGSQMGLSGTRAAAVVGISYRQLDYWARTDLVRPSLADRSGVGERRLYSYRDLLELRVVKSLLDAGIKLESVRQVFGLLRAQQGDFDSAMLVISNEGAMLVTDMDQLHGLLADSSHGIQSVLALSSVKADLDRRLLEF